jgi:hypothetical protein
MFGMGLRKKTFPEALFYRYKILFSIKSMVALHAKEVHKTSQVGGSAL